MQASSGAIKHVHISASELHMLDTLANTLLLQSHLAPSMIDACELLRVHGFAKLRNVTEFGKQSVLAFDITDEGMNYLIRQYKHKGAHV
jgi:hypothetical protein